MDEEEGEDDEGDDDDDNNNDYGDKNDSKYHEGTGRKRTRKLVRLVRKREIDRDIEKGEPRLAWWAREYKILRNLWKTEKEKHKETRVQNIEDQRFWKAAHEAAIAEQDRNIRDLQASMNKMLKRTTDPALPDNIVCDRFREVKSMWRPWAKKYSVSSIAMIDQEICRKVIQMCTPGRRLEKVLGSMSTVPTSASVILNAALSHEICKRLFEEPFFGFSAVKDGAECEAKLNQFLKAIDKGNPPQACAWRASTIELFTAYVAGRVDMRALYDMFANDFTKRYHSLFRMMDTQETEECHAELVEMFEAAGRLALQLWSQKSEIKCEIFAAFTKPFHQATELVEAHATITPEAEEGNLNGLPIDLVVEPAILAFGNSEGQKYSDYKIWMKATVLIFQKATNHLERQRDSSSYAPPKFSRLSDTMSTRASETSRNTEHSDSQRVAKRQKNDHPELNATGSVQRMRTARPDGVPHISGHENQRGPPLHVAGPSSGLSNRAATANPAYVSYSGLSVEDFAHGASAIKAEWQAQRDAEEQEERQPADDDSAQTESEGEAMASADEAGPQEATSAQGRGADCSGRFAGQHGSGGRVAGARPVDKTEDWKIDETQDDDLDKVKIESDGS